MSASVDKELEAVREMILKAAVNGDLTIKDLEERKIENQHLMLGIPYLEALIMNHTEALKQELKQSLEAQLPDCKEHVINGTSTEYNQLEEYKKSGFNQCRIQVDYAIQQVFQDKGDNRE